MLFPCFEQNNTSQATDSISNCLWKIVFIAKEIKRAGDYIDRSVKFWSSSSISTLIVVKLLFGIYCYYCSIVIEMKIFVLAALCFISASSDTIEGKYINIIKSFIFFYNEIISYAIFTSTITSSGHINW